MEKHPRILISAVLAFLIVGFLSVLPTRGQQPKVTLPNSQGTFYAPPVARADASQETTVGSPDGKWALKMKGEKGKENVVYVFSILSSSDGSQKEIFRKTVPTTSIMSIPVNTFSPDDKYIFLKEMGVGGTGYLVFSVSGAPLVKDTLTVEISGLFADKYPDYKITDVTGWGGVNLIVINTDKSDGSLGSSFWFDVASRSFIKLSTRFN